MQVVPSWQDRDVTFPYTGHNVLQNEELSTELLYTRSFFREENNAESAFYLKNTKKCYFYSNDRSNDLVLRQIPRSPPKRFIFIYCHLTVIS